MPSISAASLLRTATERNPGKTAIIWEVGQLSYGELLHRVDRLSCALAAMHIGAGDRVALLLHNGPQFVESWWATVQLGAIAVPLSTRSLPADLKATLNDAEAGAVVADGEFLPALADLRAELPSVRSIIGRHERPPADMLSYDELLTGAAAEPPHITIDLEDPCAIYYTAGTTGASKGAVRSHLSVTWGLGVLGGRIGRGEVYLGRAPMYHTGGSLTGPFAALAAGATLVTLSSFDARALLETVERHRVSRLYLHPTLVANAIFEELDRRRYDLSAVRYLQWTAGALPEQVRAEILDRFPGLPLETTYGMTEVSNIASYDYPGGGPLKSADCVGVGLPGTQVRIVGPNGHPASPDQSGEIVVQSPTMMSGYWRDAVSSQQVLVDGWLHTGDLGYVDADGDLHLSGRQKDAIITGGETVHAHEVEVVLAGLQGVAEATVIGLPDLTWGEAVTAVVVGNLTEAEIIAACHTALPGYKCPKHVIVTDSIPRNPIGKVLKHELVARYSDAPPGRNATSASS